MKSVRSVVDAPPPHVVPKNFGDSAVVLELRFWIDEPTPPRKWAAVSGVVRSVKAAFEREDIKIPFPQRELSGRAETGGFRVHGDGLVAESVDGEATDGPDSP
jgi:small-conductance mechanosensitive channel